MPKGSKGFQKGNRLSAERQLGWAQRGRFIKQQIVSMLHEAADPKQRNGPTKLRALVEKIYDMAMDGNLEAVQILFDRGEGRAVQAVQIEDVTEKRPAVIPDEVLDKMSVNELTALLEEQIKASRNPGRQSGDSVR